MNELLVLALHNTIAALVLALLVHALTRVWRSPPVAHLLWLLVLLRLVAPPVLRIDWPRVLWLADSTGARAQIMAAAPRIEEHSAKRESRFADRPSARAGDQSSATDVTGNDFAADVWLLWGQGQPVLLWLWFGGAAACAIVAARRIARFERLLRDSLPASERLRGLASEIGGKLGVRRVPDVRSLEGVEVPLLWWAGKRPVIVLPMPLARRFDDRDATLILAHELAHLRRRDHWVRVVEMLISIVYWWNPLVWVIRRRIHEAEDLCCDAWVGRAFPDCRRRYAEVVLEIAESLAGWRAGPRLLPASAFLHSFSLKARIEMILENRFAPSVSKMALFVIAVAAALVLPSSVRIARTQARAGSNDAPPSAPADKANPETAAPFPFVVKFEQGATQFAPGDKITIEEVRGTADRFIPGNIYWIKGSYTLASHERAALSAYTTAMESKDGIGVPFKVQSVRVDRGSGTFTLFLPMSCRGWPHVSFYPTQDGAQHAPQGARDPASQATIDAMWARVDAARTYGLLDPKMKAYADDLERQLLKATGTRRTPSKSGESFGGNYFGTGESVLKRWWGAKETD